MFGCFYLSDDTRKKLEAVSKWQTAFLERCRKIDAENDAKKGSKR
jgi:hypothetical protein